jgi:hypothetical protein
LLYLDLNHGFLEQALYVVLGCTFITKARFDFM